MGGTNRRSPVRSSFPPKKPANGSTGKHRNGASAKQNFPRKQGSSSSNVKLPAKQPDRRARDGETDPRSHTSADMGPASRDESSCEFRPCRGEQPADLDVSSCGQFERKRECPMAYQGGDQALAATWCDLASQQC